MFGSPTARGDYTLPELPRSVSPFIVDDSTLMTRARLVRIQGLAPAIDPQRAANILANGGDPGGTSYAITGESF